MDKLVSVDVKEVELSFRPSQRCTSATFHVTNRMHTMAVAVYLTTTRPALYTFLPGAAVVIPPLSTTRFSLILPPTDRPPMATPPDTILVRSAVLPTGKASSSAVLKLFSRPGVHVFRDASLPITIVGPHVLPALLLLPSPDALQASFLLSKSIPSCSVTDLPVLLRQAAAAGNPKFVSILLSAGANHVPRSRDGDSALSLAVKSGSIEVVRSLLAAGARPDITIDSPFHDAAAGNRADLISLLAEHTDHGAAWADAADPSGWTPVHAAAATGAVEALRICLESGGGDPDRPDASGWTPLHLAAAAGYVEVAELLIDRSKFDAKRLITGDEQRKAPFELAAESGHSQLYGVLRLNDALHGAARAGDDESVQLCLTMGAEVDVRDQNGWTALHRAAFKGKVKVVKSLIDAGAEMNDVDDDGFTALQRAVEVGQAEVALCLVAHGAKTAGIKGMVRSKDFESLGSAKLGSYPSFGKATKIKEVKKIEYFRNQVRNLRVEIS